MKKRPSFMARKFSFFIDIFYFFRKPTRWWLLFVALLMLLTGVLVMLGESSIPAPIIYALF